jgi:hypothetical protein
MSHNPQTNSQSLSPQQSSKVVAKDPTNLGFRMTFLAMVVSIAFKELGVLPLPLNYIVGYGIVLLLGYWSAPKPPYSFRRHALSIGVLITFLHAGTWGIPNMLTGLIWRPVAYGLPCFVMALGLYWWTPPFEKRRDSKLWLWAVGSVLFAVFYGWSMAL